MNQEKLKYPNIDETLTVVFMWGISELWKLSLKSKKIYDQVMIKVKLFLGILLVYI